MLPQNEAIGQIFVHPGAAIFVVRNLCHDIHSNVSNVMVNLSSARVGRGLFPYFINKKAPNRGFFVVAVGVAK